MELTFLTDVLLPRLVAATMQSVFLVAIVWALCRYMPHLGAAARCWLWWLVPLQLLTALAWPMPLRLPVLPASDAMQASRFLADQSVVVSEPMVTRTTDVQVSYAAQDVVAAAHVEGFPGWPSILLLLWLAGVVGMTANTLRGYLTARRRLAQSRPCDKSQMLHDYRQIGAALGLRRLPELRVSDSIDSPQLVGPLRPVVLIPEARTAAMAHDELDMVLRHELMHWARRDLWWGWLPALAQHAFFFNPMAHLAVREYALAREAACDAGVLSGHRHAPQDYGRLLLRLGTASPPCAGVGSASPTFQLLKRRLTMLQHATSRSHAGMLGLSIAVAVLGVVPYRIVARPLDAPMLVVQAVQASVASERIAIPVADAAPVSGAVGTTGGSSMPELAQNVEGSASPAAVQAEERDHLTAERAAWGQEQARRAAEWQDSLAAEQAAWEQEQMRFRAEQQAEQAELQTRMDAQRADQQAQMDAQRADQKAQMDAQRAEYEVQHSRLKAQRAEDPEKRTEPSGHRSSVPLSANVSAVIRGA